MPFSQYPIRPAVPTKITMASDVPWATCCERFMNRLSSGTIIAPPPTPVKPLKKPPATPVKTDVLRSALSC